MINYYAAIKKQDPQQFFKIIEQQKKEPEGMTEQIMEDATL